MALGPFATYAPPGVTPGLYGPSVKHDIREVCFCGKPAAIWYGYLTDVFDTNDYIVSVCTDHADYDVKSGMWRLLSPEEVAVRMVMDR